MVVGEDEVSLTLAQPARLRAGRLIPHPGRVRGLLLGLPAVLAGVYLIVLLVDFSSVSAAINTYGDAVITPVLGQLAGRAPAGSHILLGHHAYYEEYLFLRATAGLPFYRGLWETAPMLWTLVGFGVLAWAAWQALGRFAALLTLSAALCLGNLGQFSFFALGWHGVTVLHTILLGAALVWLAPRADRISWPRLALAAAALGLLSALPVASDPLFLAWGLVPMGLATSLMALRTRGRARWTLGAFTLVTAVLALTGGAVITQVMRASGVGTSHFTYPLIASPPGMLAHLRMLFAGLTALGGGFFFRMSLDLTGFLRLLSGLFILTALAAGLAEGGRLIARRLRARRPATQPGSGNSLATLGYVSFWLSSLVLQCLVFVGTGVPKKNLDSARYVLAGYIAIMALLPLLARRGPRWRGIVVGAVSVFALSSIVQLARRPFVEYGHFPKAPVAQRVLAFARAHDVSYGYASYWQAPDLTWLTGFRLQIYPVRVGCGQFGICPWPGAQIDSWYRFRPGTRSMLIGDSVKPPGESIDPWLGRPLAVGHFGTVTVAVYSHDIAYDLLPDRHSQPVPVAGLSPRLLPLDRARGL